MKFKKGNRIDLVSGVEFIVHEASDDAGFANRLVAQENQLVLGKRRDRRHCGDGDEA